MGLELTQLCNLQGALLPLAPSLTTLVERGVPEGRMDLVGQNQRLASRQLVQWHGLRDGQDLGRPFLQRSAPLLEMRLYCFDSVSNRFNTND